MGRKPGVSRKNIYQNDYSETSKRMTGFFVSYLVKQNFPLSRLNARFTTVPLKSESDSKCGRYSRFYLSKSVSIISLIKKCANHFCRKPTKEINS